jgi:hypothetical protein
MVFGLYWMSSASGASLQQEMSIRDRLDLLETAKLVMNLPEIQCSRAGVPDTACIDRYRITALQQELTKNSTTAQLYKDRFVTGDRGSYALYIQTISPGDQEEIRIFDYHQDDDNLSTRSVAIPTILQNPVTGLKQFSVAILTQQVNI